MRLLIFGHWSDTGFGVVTKNLALQFMDRGLDLRILAVNHRGEPVQGPLAGRIWPASIAGDGFGGNISSQAIDGTFWKAYDSEDDWKPDAVLVVSDMSGFQGHVGRITQQWLSLPVFHYCPIEGDNLPPSWAEIWEKFNPVAMSDYGQRVIAAHTGRVVPRIYHGVDSETFHPVSASSPLVYEGKVLRSKEACKAAFGFTPDQKIVLRTDRYVPRKFYDTFMRSMSYVFDRDPAVTALIHCRPQDEGGNLLEEIGRLPREQWPRVKLTQAHDTWKGLSTSDLVVLMNAADLYFSPTSGEGFGLTLAESAACGVPVVTTDHAAGPEVVGPGGVVVSPLRDSYGDPVTFHSKYGMDWAVPDARAFVDPLVSLLAKPHRRRAMGDAGRRHVVQMFRWSDAADQFVALFAAALQTAEVAA